MTDREPLYRRHRYPAEIIAHAVWLYFRFPLSLRMVEDMLAARGIIVSHRHALMTMIAYAFLQHQRLQTAKREKKETTSAQGAA